MREMRKMSKNLGSKLGLRTKLVNFEKSWTLLILTQISKELSVLVFTNKNFQFLLLFFWQNYTISPWNLSCVHNWSLKFQMSIISLSNFQNE